VFSLASYPYSFKLLWSPIVDSVYSLAGNFRKLQCSLIEAWLNPRTFPSLPACHVISRMMMRVATVGRRKSWVVPIQLMSALMLLLSAGWVDARLQVRPREDSWLALEARRTPLKPAT
jgi:hypothetical protein